MKAKEFDSMSILKTKNVLLYNIDKNEFSKFKIIDDTELTNKKINNNSIILNLKECGVLSQKEEEYENTKDNDLNFDFNNKNENKILINDDCSNLYNVTKLEGQNFKEVKEEKIKKKYINNNNKDKNKNNNNSSTLSKLNNSLSIYPSDVLDVFRDGTSIATNTNKEIENFLQKKRERYDIASYDDFVVKFKQAKQIILKVISQLQIIINSKKEKLHNGKMKLEENEIKNKIGFNSKSEFTNIGNLCFLLNDYKNKVCDPEFISRFRRYLCRKENCIYGDFCYFAHSKNDLITPKSNRSLNNNKNKSKGICKYYFYNKLCLIKNCPYLHTDA
jgi:hypothetical protein